MHKLPKLVLSDAHSTQFAAHDKVSTQRSFHGDSAKHETQNSLQNCLRTYILRYYGNFEPNPSYSNELICHPLSLRSSTFPKNNVKKAAHIS